MICSPILASLLAFTPLALSAADPAATEPVRAASVTAEPVRGAVSSGQPNLFVLKARRVEIGDGEVMEHAVMLIEDGKIVTMGQDLPVERGLPVIELDDDQVVMAGMVHPYTRYGMTGRGYNDARPYVMASAELYPSETYDAFLENGITTIAQYPAGQGMPGQAVALRPFGETAEDMVIEDGVYLKAVMRNSATNKRYIRDGFKNADEYLKKVEDARKKFEDKEKKSSKKKTSKKDDKDDKDDEEKKEDDKKKSTSKSKSKKEFEAPDPDPRVKPFLDLREGDLRALFSVRNAAAYDHLVDAIGDEEFEWHLRVPLTRDIDIFHVKEKIGDKGCYCVMEPLITLMPGTLRQRNLPAEFDRAGAKLILIPRSDSKEGFERFLADVGTMIAAGLDRKAAVRAITMHPAAMIGLGETHGTVAEGKHANLVVFNGDPFQPGTQIDAVMHRGQFVIGDIDQ